MSTITRTWGRLSLAVVAVLLGGLLLAACGDSGEEPTATTAATAPPAATPAGATPTTGPAASPAAGGDFEVPEGLSGSVAIDGSSTVFPITQAVAEEFNAEAGDVQITVGVSGTGGGFKKFCAGETDISNASRPIKDEERALCEENGVEYVELTVAYDGLSVVVNPENDWVDCLTVDQLHAIWAPESTVTNWNQVDPSFPDEPLKLYGPGTDSGTFDYFTDEINGEEGASRSDYTASEDDNVLVQGVEGDTGALGYFGYAYYVENQDRLKLVAVDNGNGCVAPSPETVADGSYAPLSRPIFIYVSTEALARPEVAAFVQFYLSDAGNAVVPEVGYITLDAATLSAERQELADALQ